MNISLDKFVIRMMMKLFNKYSNHLQLLALPMKHFPSNYDLFISSVNGLISRLGNGA